MYTARYIPEPFYPGGYWLVSKDGVEIDRIREWTDVVRRYPSCEQR